VANMVYPAVWAYYTSAAFEWGPKMVGISLACYGISMALVQGGLIRLIIGRLGELRTVYVFLWYNAVMLSVIAFIGNGWVLLALTPFSALGAVVAPALQSVMSQRAADNQQGELQGVLSSINAIGMVVAPLLFTQVFWQFTATTSPVFLPGAPFLAAAVLMAVSGAIYALTLRAAAPADAQ
jgi:DHA1 family tetracycline resistance protein-like MFS transporter